VVDWVPEGYPSARHWEKAYRGTAEPKQKQKQKQKPVNRNTRLPTGMGNKSTLPFKFKIRLGSAMFPPCQPCPEAGHRSDCGVAADERPGVGGGGGEAPRDPTHRWGAPWEREGGGTGRGGRSVGLAGVGHLLHSVWLISDGYPTRPPPLLPSIRNPRNRAPMSETIFTILKPV